MPPTFTSVHQFHTAKQNDWFTRSFYFTHYLFNCTKWTNAEVLTTSMYYPAEEAVTKIKQLRPHLWLNEIFKCHGLISVIKEECLLLLYSHHSCRHMGRWFAQLHPQRDTQRSDTLASQESLFSPYLFLTFYLTLSYKLRTPLSKFLWRVTVKTKLLWSRDDFK